jgi:ABC-type Mn2+/Zn2+ transport system ATPase subunit
LTPEPSLVPAVRLDEVTVSFESRVALDHVSFQVPEGGFVAMIGPNGAGKTTCLRVVLGLLRPQAGVVEVFGHAPGHLSGEVGYVPQRVVIPRGFPISALDVVLMGRTAILGPGRRPGPTDREAAGAALERVGLVGSGPRRFEELSGGQQQRVLIARALCGHPRLLLLDEPTAGLDSAARARFYALVCDLQQAEGLTLLCATHDLDVVGDHADTLVLLDRSVRAAGAPSEVLASGALQHAYPFPDGHVHSSTEQEAP